MKTALTKWLPGLPILAALLALVAAAPARAQYDPPKQVTLSPSGVDFTKGHFHHKATDLAIGPFKLERSYASGGPIWGSNHFGNRWTHNYSIFVYGKDTPSKLDNVLVVMGRDVVHFTRNGYTGGFSCWNPDCNGAELKWAGAAVVYTDVHGNVYTFNPSVSAFTPSAGSQPVLGSQRIASVEHADGHSLSFSYTNSKLTQVASNYGYSLVLENSSQGFITKACVYNRAVNASASDCSQAASSVTYQYGPNGDNLVNVVDLMGQNWGYDYPSATSTANLSCIRQVNSTGCRALNVYSAAPGSVTVQQTTADTAVWTTTVNRADSEPGTGQLPGEPPPYSDATFAGPEGISGVAVLGGGLLQTYHENGRTTHLAWNGIELEKLTHHEGNSVAYAKLGPITLGETWTPKPGSGLSPVSWSMLIEAQQGTSCATSPKLCHKPVWRNDYKGNQTDFAHHPDHGGVLLETGPLVNGVRPQKRYSYVERAAVTAAGAAAGRTVWLLDRMAFCRTGNPNSTNTGCDLGTGDEVVTTYDYGPTTGPNNLQLRGMTVAAAEGTLRTCYAYDSLGRKISETSPMGTTGLAACPAGPPTGALPYTSSTRYDAAGRVTGTIAPDPDGPGSPLPHPAVRNTYDNAGRLTKVEKGSLSAWQSESVAPASWTGFAVLARVETDYDSMDRKTRETAFGSDGARSSVTEYGYDLAGRLRCTAVRMNPDHWATPLGDKCAPGPAHAVHGPDRITRNSYNASGELVKVERAVGTPLAQVYAVYTYSPNGKQTSVTDANGNRAEMTWDGFDLRKRWIFPSKTAPGSADASDYEEYGYDANGSRTSLRKRDGSTLTYQYDALNRLSVKIVPERSGLAAAHTRDVHYGYDNRGLQTKARFDSLAGEGIVNVYDGFGRLVSSESNMGGTERAVGNLYDLDGHRIRVTHPDNSFFTYELDGLGRPKRIRENGGDPIFDFAYDSAGRRASSGWAAPTAYGYDPAGRLQTLSLNPAGDTRDHVLGFTYNPASQVQSRSASNPAYAWSVSDVVRVHNVNGLNQYTAAGPATFGYDPNGNLASTANAPHTTTYVYDVENRLVSATGSHNATLTYDPLGRLASVTSGGWTRRLAYDGDALVAEYEPGGYMFHRYIHGNDSKADDPLIWYDNWNSGWRRALLTDHQGSVIQVADMYGNPVGTNSYDPWGIPGGTPVGRFGYTGQTWVPELGLWYYKARIYSPTLGRFLQVDPVGYDDQINLYAYVGNDPMNRIDPTGLYEINCAGSKTCNRAAERFESARLANLQSKHADVVAAARAWGAPGEANGISVNFLSSKAMEDKYKDSTTDGAVTGVVFTGNKASMNVDIKASLSGRDMRATVAHEGTHVVRINALASSYNPVSGKYSASLNLTVRQMEIQAWSVQNRITGQFKSASAIEQHIDKSYQKELLGRFTMKPEFTE